MLMLRHGEASFLPSLGQSHMRMERCDYLQPLNWCPTARCQGNYVMQISMHMSLCCPMPSGNREQQRASKHNGVVQDDPQPLLRTSPVTLFSCEIGVQRCTACVSFADVGSASVCLLPLSR